VNWFLYDKDTLDAMISKFYTETSKASDFLYRIRVMAPPRHIPGRMVSPQTFMFPQTDDQEQSGSSARGEDPPADTDHQT
jgi:hypothetical protein